MILEASDANIERAARLLAAGELVAFPTETVYGLGGEAANPAAIERIFEIKGRPKSNPLIVHIADSAEVSKVAEIVPGSLEEKRLRLLSQLWPGPLTVVLPKAPHISHLVTAGQDSIAVRVPNHPVALKLLRSFGGPIAAPSANRFTTVSPTRAQHVEHSFGDAIASILDGGPCQVGIESTIVSITSESPVLLRPGIITKEKIEGLLRETVKMSSTNSRDRAPGMFDKHYSPVTPLALLRDIEIDNLPAKIGLVTIGEHGPEGLPSGISERCRLSDKGDLNEVAYRLYDTLINMDSKGLDLILIEGCDSKGFGQAIMDRITKACGR